VKVPTGGHSPRARDLGPGQDPARFRSRQSQSGWEKDDRRMGPRLER
jgi:hypothetical protein